MVEATVNPKYQRIKDYLMNMSEDNNISEEFIDRFVYNYMNKGGRGHKTIYLVS